MTCCVDDLSFVVVTVLGCTECPPFFCRTCLAKNWLGCCTVKDCGAGGCLASRTLASRTPAYLRVRGFSGRGSPGCGYPKSESAREGRNTPLSCFNEFLHFKLCCVNMNMSMYMQMHIQMHLQMYGHMRMHTRMHMHMHMQMHVVLYTGVIQRCLPCPVGT